MITNHQHHMGYIVPQSLLLRGTMYHIVMESTKQLAEYIRKHTAARGVDLWAVEVEEYSAAEWARRTGRDRSTVARNVRRARGEEETDSENWPPEDWEFDGMYDVSDRWDITMEEAEVFLENIGFFASQRPNDT